MDEQGPPASRAVTLHPGPRLVAITRAAEGLSEAARMIHHLTRTVRGTGEPLNRAAMGRKLGYSRLTVSASIQALEQAGLLVPPSDSGSATVHRVNSWLEVSALAQGLTETGPSDR